MDRETTDLIEELASKALLLAQSEAEDISFDSRGVEWLQSHLEALRHARRELSNEETGQLGAFLGRCILARYGGEWCLAEGQAAVRLPDGTVAFPMNRVRKQVTDGVAASVGSLYVALASIVSRRDTAEPPDAPDGEGAAGDS